MSNLYSGDTNGIRVKIQAGKRPVAHTHPPTNTGEYDTLPSSADINVLNDIWNINPDGTRPKSMIIWGPEPGNVTVYHATGTERVTK